MTKLPIALSLLALSSVAAAEPDTAAPYTPDPGPHKGNWEATLTGTGLSSDDFDSSNFGMTASLGYYMSENVIFTLKQGVQLDDNDDATLAAGRTILQAAYQWDRGKWQPYIGMNVGGVYGGAVDNEAVAGPEIGLKYFVNESTFVFGNIGYEVPVDECCGDGVVPYSVGIGFDF